MNSAVKHEERSVVMKQHGPLHGVTVLDLGQIYNGPYATFLMAMAGARIIKIEPLEGESMRQRLDGGAHRRPLSPTQPRGLANKGSNNNGEAQSHNWT